MRSKKGFKRFEVKRSKANELQKTSKQQQQLQMLLQQQQQGLFQHTKVMLKFKLRLRCCFGRMLKNTYFICLYMYTLRKQS